MKLTTDQIAEFHENGYLILPDVFNGEEIKIIRNEMNEVITEDCPRRILEKNGSIRSFFAPDHTNELFNRLVRLKKIVGPSSQLVGDEVYIHQTKINTKHAMSGDWWPWHQDYVYWKLDDGMPQPDVLTAMIYLNDVNEFNGPLLLIPGSHKLGIADMEDENNKKADTANEWFQKYKTSTPYMSALTADLKYTLGQYTIAQWAEKNGICSAKGKEGSVLFFHGNIFHASSNNLSPWDRHTFLITYNSLKNRLPDIKNPRPGFIANRDFRPVAPLYEDFSYEIAEIAR